MEKREPSYTVGGMQVAPQLGRSVEIDSDQIKTLTENNHCTTWEIADILKIPKSLKFLVKNEKFYFMEKKTMQTFWPTQHLRKSLISSVLITWDFSVPLLCYL